MELYVLRKERKKLRGFVSSTVNEWMDLKERKKKGRKKKREEKDCWERPLCLTMLAGLNIAYS